MRIAIVDDHALVASAVASLIDAAPELEFVGHAASVPELLSQGVSAELVVLDLALRDSSSPQENVRAITARGMGVLVLTSGENPYLIREAARADILGMVSKTAPTEEIIAAITTAAAGGHVTSTDWAAALDGDPALSAAPLTDREREVLALYASGLGAKSVAQRLHITENTVDDHIRRIRSVYRQLRRPADTKVALYQRGVEDGYLPPPIG